MKLRACTKADLPALLALQRRLAPERRWMTEAALEEALFDQARAGGANTALAGEPAAPRGFAGWVRGGEGEFFLSPLCAEGQEAAAALVGHALEAARGCAWARVSVYPEEKAKRGVLAGEGFAPLFEFIDYAWPCQGFPAPALPPGLSERPVRELAAAEFVELHNVSFRGVDNSLPIDEDKAREIMASRALDDHLSLAWREPGGRPVAFSLANDDGYLDAIGVHPDCQGRGYGTLLYRRIRAAAHARGLSRLTALVSSRNVGSLALHRRLAIPEVERREVWAKDLGGKA